MDTVDVDVAVTSPDDQIGYVQRVRVDIAFSSNILADDILAGN